MNRTHAVVLGGSMAGLLAARVLSNTFDRVSIVDRDDLSGTGPRRGVPQGLHAHAILARGREIIEDLFPGVTAELTEAGALPFDLVEGLHWHNGPRPMRRSESGLLALGVSRPALEDRLRAWVRALSNVDILDRNEAVGLIGSDDRRRVTGAQVLPVDGGERRPLPADLVVDATGRGNRGPVWLAELGYDAPVEETVKAGIVYATREYHRRPLPSGLAGVVTGVSPSCPSGVALLPMEGERWILTLAGFNDDVPPIEEAGFNDYVRRFPIADLHDLLDHAPTLTTPRRYRVPASIRRRYERLPRLPEGYLAIGDALCSFNPIYGQGMTVAAAQATQLRDCLHLDASRLARQFYRRAARIIDIAWDIAVGGDLAFPAVIGRRTAKVRITNAYVARVLRAAETDPQVCLAFLRTVNLNDPPHRLFAPSLLRRVLFPRRGRHAPNRAAAPVG